MNVLILQHIKIEDPGYIKDLMIKDGANLTTIELDEGEKIPTDLSKFDAMLCMGGPLSLIHISEPTRQEAISYAVTTMVNGHRLGER